MKCMMNAAFHNFDNLQNNVNLSYFLTFATKNAIGSLGRGRLHAGIANGF